MTGFVFAHDDPTPGLSLRGLLTIALAAAVVVLLTIRRTAGPGPLTRALSEYAVVFLLAVLVATTGITLDQPAAAGGKTASAAPDQRPALVKTIDGFRDWLSQWRTGPARRPTAAPSPPPPPDPRAPAPVPLDQEAAVTLRFSDLNPLGRAIIIVVAALTFGVAAVSFATSYGALYAYARDTGLYSERLTRLWPLLLDGAFIVAQLAAILAGILRGSRGWPILTMLLTGALTVWFNLQHAGSRPRPPPGRRPAAGADDAGLRDRRADRPLGHDRPRQAPGPDRSPTRRRACCPGAVWRSDGLGWNVPPNGLPSGWPPGAYGQIPAGHHLPENRQNGQAGLAAGNGADPAGMTKRAAHRGIPGLARPRRAPAPDRARADRRPGQPGPGGHRALRQADPRPAAAPTPAPAAGERRPQAAPMTGAEPAPRGARGRLRPVPEPDREPPHNLEAEEAVLGAVLAAGRLLAEVAALLEEADFYRPAHRAIWRAMLRLADRGPAHRPGDRAGGAGRQPGAGRCGRRPVPAHPGRRPCPRWPTPATTPSLVAEAARRRRVIDLGIQLAHSDADPAVLAHLAGELADTTTAATVGAAGSRPSRSGSPARCPRSRSRSCPAGWASTWPPSPPPPRPHPTWPACSPWPCSPPWPPARSRSSPGPAGASRCACSWPWAWTPGPARAACSPP